MSIYQQDPNKRPDAEFQLGELYHLVPGNPGRVRDPRRTPIKVVGIEPESATWILEITAFEDKGAQWEETFERIDRYQFEIGCPRISDEEHRSYQNAVARFNKPLEIIANQAQWTEAREKVQKGRKYAGDWLDGHSRFFAENVDVPPPETREGPPLLFEDLRNYMESLDLWEIEDAFATDFVRFPLSELVKGHRIVLAELGFVSYWGQVTRKKDVFDDLWSKQNRGRHILSRFAFLQELFKRLGRERVLLFRGYFLGWRPGIYPPPTFVSTSFCREVSASLAYAEGNKAHPVLRGQATKIDRIFMTYLETAQMNRQYKEAEAVLMYDPQGPAF